MIIQHDVSLSQYTTFRMGGIAKTFYIPQSEEELYNLIKTKRLPRYLIGGGSNILINDKKTFDEVISLKEFNTEIKSLGDGIYYIGASVRLQKVIATINAEGYGGIEYLQSVPGLIGGAIAMNAGRSNRIDEIGKYVLSVRVIKNDQIVELNNSQCQFGHRSSVFKNSDMIITGATLKFIKNDPVFFEEKRKERIEFAKKYQDNSMPNFGSVFSSANSIILEIVRRTSKAKTGIYFSTKTANWLLNNNGTFAEAIKKIDRIKAIHKMFGLACKPEVVIWK